MNHKLRTARNSIVIILTILCIVCLSLGLFFAAFSVSYAEEPETNELPYYDSSSNPLWLVTYDGNDAGVPLINGADISYVDYLNGEYVVVSDDTSENALTPYRGKALSLVINNDYILPEGETIGSVYANVDYNHTNTVTLGGLSDRKLDIPTQATLSKESGETLVINKNWSIVPTSNVIRNSTGSKDVLTRYIDGALTYLDVSTYAEARPEHGNTVIYSIYNSKEENLVERFAVDYSTGSAKYFQADDVDGFDVASATPIENTTGMSYLNSVLQTLIGGSYRLEVCAPAYVMDADKTHTHWWMASPSETPSEDICYAKTTYTFNFVVQSYEFTQDKLNSGVITLTGSEQPVQYNGQVNNTPHITLTINGVTLTQGIDYVLESDQINVGPANLRIVGQAGRLVGTVVLENAYYIMQASNSWQDNITPGILSWTYGTYNKVNNVLSGMPTLLDAGAAVTYKITRDEAGEDVVLGLGGFTAVDGIVDDSIATILEKLDVGTYYLRTKVNGSANYDEIVAISPFQIFKGENAWTSEPKFNTWIQGKYDEVENAISAASKYGKVAILIRDLDGNKYYEALGDDIKLNNLSATKKNTTYILTMKVQGTANYGELAIEPIVFEVLPFGLPWWAVTLIVVGALGIVAMIFGIMHQKGVLQMLTGKVVLAMRTRANVDATIAAVRAAKVARDAEISIAAAKAREAEEAEKSQKK